MDSKQQIRYFKVTASLDDLKLEGINKDIRGRVGEVDERGIYYDGYILLKIPPKEELKEKLGDHIKAEYYDIPKSFTIEIKKDEE